MKCQSDEKLQLSLGCFGLIDDGFVSCSGCENRILIVDNHLDKYNEMMDYFETCRLFDRPMFEYNSIRHFVYNMQNKFDQIAKPLWFPNKYNLIERFIVDHRRCGLYTKLVIDKEELKIPEQDPIIVPASAFKKKTKSKAVLKLIRGRR